LQQLGSIDGGPRYFRRSYAAELGREGTSGDELSGDPNRAPQKEEDRSEGKEGKDDIDEVLFVSIRPFTSGRQIPLLVRIEFALLLLH